MSAADADRISRQAMGNVTLAREDARAMRVAPWIESIGQDARYAVRTLRRAPAFAAAMILVTALGISATTAIFGLIDGLVLADLPVREPARLAWFKDPAFSYPIFTAVRARSAALFSGLFAWNVERRSVQWREAAEHADVLAASGGFYATLGVSAVVGRTFGEADDRPGGGPGGPVAVISDACWQRRFARDPAAVGSNGPDRPRRLHDHRRGAARFLWRGAGPRAGPDHPAHDGGGAVEPERTFDVLAAPDGPPARRPDAHERQQHAARSVARRARRDNGDRHATGSPGDVSGPHDSTATRQRRVLARPQPVRGAALDPARPRRPAVGGGVGERREPAAVAQPDAAKRDGRPGGHRRQPRPGGAAVPGRSHGVDGNRGGDRGRAGIVERRRAGRGDLDVARSDCPRRQPQPAHGHVRGAAGARNGMAERRTRGARHDPVRSVTGDEDGVTAQRAAGAGRPATGSSSARSR